MIRNISAVVLSGGKSSRMGQDKALLAFQNSCFLQHTIDLLENFTKSIYISSNTPYRGVQYPIIQDEHVDVGPLTGIYSVLKKINTQKLLVIAVDTPLLDTEVINHLLSGVEPEDQITVIKTVDGYQMLVAVYDRSILPIIEKQIIGADYKLSNLLKLVQVKEVYLEKKQEAFSNINTKEDYQKLIY